MLQPEEIVKMINNPSNFDEQTLINTVKTLCKQKEKVKFEYDGLNYCALSGEDLANNDIITIQTVEKKEVVVLKQKLIQLIEEHCFFNNIFEWSFATIKNIQFLTIQELQTIEIDEALLENVYGKQRSGEILENSRRFYNDYQMSQKDQQYDITFICPMTKKLCYMLEDGIRIQTKLFSLDGAIQLLQNDQDKLFPHQIEFLEQYKLLKQY